MINIYEKLREQALLKTNNFNDDAFIIRGLWKTNLIFKPNNFERTFNYVFILAQTIGQGCCYCSTDVFLDQELIGKDARKIISQRNCINIAILDSIFSSILKKPERSYKLKGNSIEKTDKRNLIILKEAEKLIKKIDKKEIQIVNIGVVGDLIKKLKDNNYIVFATDTEKNIVGKSLHGVKIKPSKKTLEYIKKCDLAIITGMTISTNSLENILRIANKYDTKLLIFAETGANFAEEYCRYGIDVVVSEPFPFYIFEGLTEINIYYKNTTTR